MGDLRNPVARHVQRGHLAALFFGPAFPAAIPAAIPVAFPVAFALAFATALVGVPTPAVADDAIGSVTYLEGTVTMTRDGADVDDVAIGHDVQAFDSVRTGDDGQAEISIDAKQLPQMTIKVSPDTQFTVEVASTASGGTQSTVGILGGQIALKVAKLLPSQAVGVKTDYAAMGVRGTDFTVTAPETGDVLVTCDEGEVSVTDDQGQSLSAVPGTVVEKQAGATYRTLPVAAAGLQQFRAQWRDQRAQFLRANALQIIRANARLYRELSRQFNDLHAELNRNQAITRKWAFEDRGRRMGSRAEVLRERRTIGELLVRMRRVSFRLERVSFRLERLQALHDQGVGVGSLEDGTTTAVFFEQVRRERQDMARKLAVTRQLTKQFVRRNEGRLPE